MGLGFEVSGLAVGEMGPDCAIGRRTIVAVIARRHERQVVGKKVGEAVDGSGAAVVASIAEIEVVGGVPIIDELAEEGAAVPAANETIGVVGDEEFTGLKRESRASGEHF